MPQGDPSLYLKQNPYMGKPYMRMYGGDDGYRNMSQMSAELTGQQIPGLATDSIAAPTPGGGTPGPAVTTKNNVEIGRERANEAIAGAQSASMGGDRFQGAAPPADFRPTGIAGEVAPVPDRFMSRVPNIPAQPNAPRPTRPVWQPRFFNPTMPQPVNWQDRFRDLLGPIGETMRQRIPLSTRAETFAGQMSKPAGGGYSDISNRTTQANQ